MILLRYSNKPIFYRNQVNSVGNSVDVKWVTPTKPMIIKNTQLNRNHSRSVPNVVNPALLSPTPPKVIHITQQRKNIMTPNKILRAEPNPSIYTHPNTHAVDITADRIIFNQVHLRESLLNIIPHIIADDM